MKVLLDSNIIIADFNLKRPAAQILLSLAKTGTFEVYVPEVVFDEVVNKFRQHLEDRKKDILSAMKTIKDMVNDDIPIPIPITDEFAQKAHSAYQQRLQIILSENKISILQYPTTDHKYLAKKAMLQRKPFNVNEKGYRDCLIWENVKSLIPLLSSTPISISTIAFITNNNSDFMSDDKLHNNLLTELKEEGYNTETVKIFKSLKEFDEQIMKPYLEKVDEFKTMVNDGSTLKEILTEYLYNEYIGQDLCSFEFVSPGDYFEEGRTVIEFDDDFEIKDPEVKKLNDEFVVYFRLTLDTELEFYIDKSEYYSQDLSYNVIDNDWNDHVMLVSQKEPIEFSVTMIINANMESQSIEMNKVD